MNDEKAQVLAQQLGFETDSEVTVLLKACLNRVSHSEWLGMLLVDADLRANEMLYGALLRVGHVLSWGSEAHAMKHISQSMGALAIVPLAVYCFLKHLPNRERCSLCAKGAPVEAERVLSLVNLLLDEGE